MSYWDGPDYGYSRRYIPRSFDTYGIESTVENDMGSPNKTPTIYNDDLYPTSDQYSKSIPVGGNITTNKVEQFAVEHTCQCAACKAATTNVACICSWCSGTDLKSIIIMFLMIIIVITMISDYIIMSRMQRYFPVHAPVQPVNV